VNTHKISRLSLFLYNPFLFEGTGALKRKECPQVIIKTNITLAATVN